MPSVPYRTQLVRNYLRSVLIRDLHASQADVDAILTQMQFNFTILIAILQTRYLRACPPILKVPNLHLAWA